MIGRTQYDIDRVKVPVIVLRPQVGNALRSVRIAFLAFLDQPQTKSPP